MKVLLNWRYYVITALFTLGLLAVVRAFGNPAKPMSDLDWLGQTLISLSVGGVCFYALVKLIKLWERDSKIPEFTNLRKE